VNEPGRARTLLAVPLLRGANVIGFITLARIAPRPFTERQIDLVATIANQAVIAINNVDLFEEVQARTREVTESLEQQTATAEVSAGRPSICNVYSMRWSAAARLCDAYDAAIFQVLGDGLRLVAHHGQIP
jgi:two-component system NtrC family sensor kinase